ncbi:hypothetical protein CKO25_15390 [Thiocapsa imhoffii]|uniref:YtxH domain-containing protein n=1 Tax=Thiocapsa imhoffii TaxID=382777 RepID=A0A9X1B9L8_9GAMM|nr:YtxH domain-containing protein [Thiocapsa imhoffii]MBK1646007.1 hypothetical protein [Thiocapsa imhoffii]
MSDNPHERKPMYDATGSYGTGYGMGSGMSPSGMPGRPGIYPGYPPNADWMRGVDPGWAAMPGDSAARYPRPSAPAPASSFFNFNNDRFLKGLLIGAAATYLLTNESVQRTAIKGVVQLWSAVQGGIEEAKERFHDAEAELRHASQSKSE